MLFEKVFAYKLDSAGHKLRAPLHSDTYTCRSINVFVFLASGSKLYHWIASLLLTHFVARVMLGWVCEWLKVCGREF